MPTRISARHWRPDARGGDLGGLRDRLSAVAQVALAGSWALLCMLGLVRQTRGACAKAALETQGTRSLNLVFSAKGVLAGAEAFKQDIPQRGRSWDPVRPTSRWADGRYDSLRPSVTGMRAARTAGKSPPTKPIANAHFRPSAISVGVTRNWNTIEV